MLNKKNIAMSMAAATAFTAVAPVAQSFAAVIDSNQEQEIKNLKADVLEKFNTKYTKNEALLNRVTPGASVYTITIDGVSETLSNYAEFEKAFDKKYNELENGQKIVVNYDSTTNLVNVLEDGEVVNFKEAEYDSIQYDSTTKTGSGITAPAGMTIVYGELEDKTPYAKIPVTDGYITVKNGDVKLNLSAPKFRVVDGYYVDADGYSIKKFDESRVLADIAFVKGKGGVVEGYYQDVTATPAERDKGSFAIVKTVESATKEELTTDDLYEVKAGRLTKKGNELRKALLNSELVKPSSERLLNVEITGTDKAGEKVTKNLTTLTSAERENLSNIKIVFSQRENTISEYKPVYEFVITSVKGNDFNAVIDSIIGSTDTTVDVAAGLDRYETAVELSKQGWKGTAGAITDHVVLVSGDSNKLVDGLTATPLAAKLDAPVLLTKKDSIPQEVIDEIARLGAKNVTIVGGTSAVSEEVETLLARTYGKKVTRLEGKDRYETSLAVASELKELTGSNNKFKHAFVVGGKGEADALSVSAIAGIRELPIILTPEGDLTKDAEYFIDKNVALANHDTNIFVVGGTNSVSSQVQNELVDAGFKVERLAGEVRQETNAKVLDRFKNSSAMGGRTIDDVVVAKSDNNGLIDALAAGALAAKNEAHIVLATNELTESQTEALNEVYPKANVVNSKVQAGYGIASKVASVIKSLGR